MERTYIAIDLKSFYASVECIERGLNPFNANLVVADSSRTEKTICLAVSPSLKGYGVPGRPRLFEVVSKVKEINYQRAQKNGGKLSNKKSIFASELERDKSLVLDYVIAKPQMALYIKYSTQIYNIYLEFVAPEDIHVYSIDEVFIDVTSYLNAYKLTAYELALKIIKKVLKKTGITATAGIGSNLYLAKVAMDVIAKHVPADEDGVRIAELNVLSYRKLLWSHQPLTDFWRVGRGYEKKLKKMGLYTMGDIARYSLVNEGRLYDEFGVNAELLIDHAWGIEPCTIDYIKAYKPLVKSMGSGQVLHCAYPYDKALLVVKEMADLLALDLVEQGLSTNQIVLTIGYDAENVDDSFSGEYSFDIYGRKLPKHAHGTINLPFYTSSSQMLVSHAVELYESIVNKAYLIRKINIVAGKVLPDGAIETPPEIVQMDFFTDYDQKEKQAKAQREKLDREKQGQKAVLDIKKKYGKNAIVKGMNLESGATAIDRNNQIGGHKA